jgi:hypothetical protein
MEYKFTPAHENYAPYASGGVFYSAPGHPALPIRLANELFRRCLAWRAISGAAGPCTLYDPCCGGAYHLATLAHFNWERIAAIYASDVDADALAVAARNLALLSPAGLERRAAELDALHQQFGKDSHAASLAHAHALQGRLAELHAGHAIATHLFCADATDATAVRAGLAGARIDIVIADIPYGQASQWQLTAAPAGDAAAPVQRLLDSVLPVLAAHAVVAVAAGKQDKIRHAAYRRLERFTVGKRQLVILQPALATPQP